MRPDPVIRIISLLLVAAVLSRGRVVDMGLTVLLLLAGLAMSGQGSSAGLLRLLARVRWLLVSLVLVYGWFTPGMPLLPALGALSPTLSGLAAGGQRAMALLLMVSAVHLLLKTTTRQELLSALYRMSRVARPLGLDPERFAVRVVLVLETVPGVQDLVTGVRNERRTGISSAAASLYRQVLARAEQSVPGPVSLPDLRPVPPLQWVIPLALLLAYAGAGWLASMASGAGI